MSSTEYARLVAPVEIAGSVARITCAQCGARAEWTLVRRPPPDIIHKHFTTRGWQIGRRVICPAHIAPQRSKPAVSSKPNPAPKTTPPHMNSGAVPAGVVVSPPIFPTDAAKRVKRLVFQALEDAYDDVARRYRSGWDDARVAKETGAAPEFVRKEREENFGPLRAPSEVEVLQARADALLLTAETLHADLAELRKRNGWA